jgi:hypothetical protein
MTHGLRHPRQFRHGVTARTGVYRSDGVIPGKDSSLLLFFYWHASWPGVSAMTQVDLLP